MELDEIAKKLGYSDADNLQANIDSYGQPLQEWWNVITDLVNNINFIPCCKELCEDETHKTTSKIEDAYRCDCGKIKIY